MLSPAETGIRGNSHMIMQDKNNLQVADLILKWIDERVSKRSGAQVTRRSPRIHRDGVGLATGALRLALTVARLLAVQSAPRLALELEDYAALPITADNTDQNTRAQLARVNYLRDEPGGRRFFVNDLNGPLYILDKQTKAFTKYLDFNGARRPARAVPEVHLRAKLRDRTHQRHPRSRLCPERRVLHAPHGRSVDARFRSATERRRARPRSLRIHDDAGRADADGQRADRSRGRARRVEGSEHRECHVRRHGPGNPARAVSAGAASVGRDDLQSGRAAWRSGLASHVSRARATRSPASNATAAA